MRAFSREMRSRENFPYTKRAPGGEVESAGLSLFLSLSFSRALFFRSLQKKKEGCSSFFVRAAFACFKCCCARELTRSSSSSFLFDFAHKNRMGHLQVWEDNEAADRVREGRLPGWVGAEVHHRPGLEEAEEEEGTTEIVGTDRLRERADRK